MGIEPASSLQAIVFATMFSGVVSMSDEMVARDFGVPKKNLVGNFQVGTETALSRAHLLRTTKVETLQAFVMYMVCIIQRAYSDSCSRSLRSHCAVVKCHAHILPSVVPPYGSQSAWAYTETALSMGSRPSKPMYGG